ncbi:methyl-accepting chemotaxis protein [Lachnospiraceae bacterium JC7]|nr:methyl-accepting chemotaxis protein [Lachnospiraceae bacterium JC7]
MKEKPSPKKGYAPKNWLKNLRLNTRLSLIIGVFTLFIFILLNIVVNRLFTNVMNRMTSRGIQDICAKNVGDIRSIVERNDVLAKPLVESVKTMLEKVDDGEKLYPSIVDPSVNLTEIRADEETVIKNDLWAIVNSNENIEGAGVFFNQNMFTEDIPYYEPFVTRDDLVNQTVGTLSYDLFKDMDYFTRSGSLNQTIYGIPFKSDVTGNMIIPAAYPIVVDDTFVGIVCIDISTKIFDSMLVDDRDTYETLTVELDTGDQYVVYSNNKDSEGKHFSDLLPPASVEFYKKMFGAGKAFMRENTGVRRYYTPVSVGGETWWVHTAVTVEELMRDINQLTFTLTIIQMVALILLLVLLSFLLRRSLKPLEDLAVIADNVSNGVLKAEVNYSYNDEIGHLANSMQNMISRFRNIIENLGNKLHEMSNGNLQIENHETDIFVGDFLPLLQSMDVITEKLNATMIDIRKASLRVNESSDQVASGAQALAQGATEQASSVEDLTNEMQKINEGISKTSEKTIHANNLSREGSSAVDESNKRMEELTQAMNAIMAKSKEIGAIIKTIDSIAFQTNILALNASVEAARAGVAGKGFAVVADEVGNLAHKSAEAAKSTASLIQDALDAIERGGEITKITAESLMRAAESTDQVTVLIDEIAVAMNEQTTAVNKVSQGLGNISSVVQTNSATSEESAAASNELSNQASQMNQLIERFRLKG